MPDETSAALEYRLAVERRLTTLEQQFIARFQEVADTNARTVAMLGRIEKRLEDSGAWHEAHSLDHALKQGVEAGMMQVQAQFSSRDRWLFASALSFGGFLIALVGFIAGGR